MYFPNNTLFSDTLQTRILQKEPNNCDTLLLNQALHSDHPTFVNSLKRALHSDNL